MTTLVNIRYVSSFILDTLWPSQPEGMAPRGGGAAGGGGGFLYHPSYPPSTTVYAHTTPVPAYYSPGRYSVSPMAGSPIDRMQTTTIGYPGKTLQKFNTYTVDLKIQSFS